MKKIFTLLLIIFLIYSCAKKEEKKILSNGSEKINSAAVEGDWIVLSFPAEPETLNPIIASDAYESRVNSYIMESLLERDKETLELKPLLADTYYISENKLEYTFVIKKGIKWHNEIDFTVDDIIYSFERIKDTKVFAPHLRNYYQDVESAEKIDTYTVRFKCKKKYFLQLDFLGGLPIVCKKVFDNGEDFNKHSAGRHPIGTGPYIFEKWKTGEKIVLKKNPNYWGEKKYLNKIIIKIITDSTATLQMLKRGDIDLTGLEPIQWIQETKSKSFNENFIKLEYFLQNYNFIGWNSKKIFFNDKRVRWAMTHLLDRQQILDEIYYGYGVLTTGPFYVFSDAYDSTLKPIEYDIEKAKKLLEESGWRDTNNNGILDKNGVEFRFEFLIVSGSRIAEQIATILKENLKRVGIEMIIRQLEWATFLNRIDNREFDAVILGWSMGIESDPYQLWHSSLANEKNSSNFVSFANKEADKIIEQAREEFDKEKRNALYRKFHRIIYDEQPYTFLFCPKALGAVHKRFQNVKTYKIRPGYDITEWWVPLNLQKYK